MQYYILPTNKDLQHHGVLGMKWGVRRYQPYSVVPRGSGEGGKEVGEAAKVNEEAAKHNVKTAYKQIKDVAFNYEHVNDKISRLNKKGKTEKAKSYAEKTKEAQLRRKEILDKAMSEIDNADLQAGVKLVNKTITQQISKDLIMGSMKSSIAYNVGLNALRLAGIPTTWAPPIMISPAFKETAAKSYIAKNRTRPVSYDNVKQYAKKEVFFDDYSTKAYEDVANSLLNKPVKDVVQSYNKYNKEYGKAVQDWCNWYQGKTNATEDSVSKSLNLGFAKFEASYNVLHAKLDDKEWKKSTKTFKP